LNFGVNTAAALIETLSAPEQVMNVLHQAHTAAHGHGQTPGWPCVPECGGVAAVTAGGDIEKGNLVGAPLCSLPGKFHRPPASRPFSNF
jgi:hypothetical protein